VATDPVPTRVPGNSIVEAGWFRFLVRTALALLAFWILSFAADRYTAFAEAAVEFRNYDSLWLSWIGAAVAAGLLFGLATWLPFTRIRFLPSRLLLAAAALMPIAHFWWVIVRRGTGAVQVRLYWFDATPIQFVLAVLSGVAIASGFRVKRSRQARELHRVLCAP
jgi:hypothetical protein